MANHKITIAGKDFALPQSRPVRIGIGGLFIVGGILGFLPILGFWMVPLGFLILSFDIPVVRRWRQRLTVWWRNRAARRDPGDLPPPVRHHEK